MERKKLRVGIAGYGIVGKRRRYYIDQHPRLQTVAVCDQNFDESGMFPDGVLFFSHYRQLIEVPLDVLFVSLPNYLAAEVTIEGLEHGMHVFCEKPPGRTVSDIRNVIEVERKHQGQLLKYGFNHRYHDSVRKSLEIIKSGEMGEIVNLRGVYGKSKIIQFSGGWRAERRYAGGGILLDQGIHMVDLIRLFCGEFVEVKSYISNSYWHHDVEDNAYALMRDSEGRVAMLHSTATQWQHRFRLDIALTEGYLELQGILSGSKSYGEERLNIGWRDEAQVGTTKEETITYLEDNSWGEEVNEFADAIDNGTSIQSGNSMDALKTMELVYKIYCSDREWRDTYQIECPDRITP
ncbi:MAG: Gfo/Idh/MocA family oxidoreductase [Deltaproteobacteria bacterium]|nr:Gfo/Idh/MocA family oxidoreductase [Deltaproteobacteria bacterium]